MRLVVIGSVLILLAAPPAFAGGFNLTWGTGCWSDSPASLRTFACDTNTGSVSLVASFENDGYPLSTNFLKGRLDLQSDSPLLPDWWQIGGVGACRTGSLSVSTDFLGAPGGCVDFWQGQPPTVGFHWVTTAVPDVYAPPSAPNRARLNVRTGILSRSFPIEPGVEYYAFRVTIDFARSVGACTGCATPATLVLNELEYSGDLVTTPLANACLRWQAAGVTPCSATPARNPTWGQVKGLYR